MVSLITIQVCRRAAGLQTEYPFLRFHQYSLDNAASMSAPKEWPFFVLFQLIEAQRRTVSSVSTDGPGLLSAGPVTIPNPMGRSSHSQPGVDAAGPQAGKAGAAPHILASGSSHTARLSAPNVLSTISSTGFASGNGEQRPLRDNPGVKAQQKGVVSHQNPAHVATVRYGSTGTTGPRRQPPRPPRRSKTGA